MTTNETQVECSRDDIRRVVEDVFETMLEMKVREDAAVTVLPDGFLTATIHFAGGWNGALLLQCSLRQACAFASRLIPGSAPEQFDEDVCDALGELANMIGGNLKSVLHPGAALSMPSVVMGIDHSVHFPEETAAAVAGFTGPQGAFLVTIVQMRMRSR